MTLRELHTQVYDSSTLEVSFSKLLDDIVKLFTLYRECFFSDRLIESIDDEEERQTSLVDNIEERLQSVKYDIDLVKSKIEKGYLRSIDLQNEKIEELVYNLVAITRSTHMKSVSRDEVRLKNELLERASELEELIIRYNERAERSHKRKLKTLKSAREELVSQLLQSAIRFGGEI
jgi:hypothetical protein